MGEYDDMFRPSIDQRLQQAARERADLSAAIDQIATLRAEVERLKGELAAYEAQAQSEQTTVLDSWMRRCNELECERNRLDGELREALATIERLEAQVGDPRDHVTTAIRIVRRMHPGSLKVLPHHQDVMDVARILAVAENDADGYDESGKADMLAMQQGLESALASAKPEPSTNARPGWVAVPTSKHPNDDYTPTDDEKERGESVVQGVINVFGRRIKAAGLGDIYDHMRQSVAEEIAEARMSMLCNDGVSCQATSDSRPGWVAVGVLRERSRELRRRSYELEPLASASLSRAADELDRITDNAVSEPEPPPGFVSARVLREVASKWAERSDVSDPRSAGFEYGQAVCAGELTAIADNAGDAEAVERAAFELVEERLRGVDAATVTLVRDAVMIGTNKMWSERAESAYAAYRALAGKGG